MHSRLSLCTCVVRLSLTCVVVERYFDVLLEIILNSNDNLPKNLEHQTSFTTIQKLVISNLILRYKRQLKLPACGKVPGFGCIFGGLSVHFLFRTVLGVE